MLAIIVEAETVRTGTTHNASKAPARNAIAMLSSYSTNGLFTVCRRSCLVLVLVRKAGPQLWRAVEI